MDEFIKAYEQATQAFLDVVSQLEEADLDTKSSDGWSPRQVIHHVADSETQSYARLRKLIAEPGSVIQGYDEALWAGNETLGYQELPIELSMSLIKAVRESSWNLLSRLKSAQLANECTHSESGPYSLSDWINIYTNHPLEHAQQIKDQLL